MITQQQAAGAVLEMGICRYFPSDDFRLAQIADLLIRMVENENQLRWLVSAQVNFEWRGPEDLRKRFCSKFSPRDRIEADSEHPGLTSGELEHAYLEEQGREFDRKLIEWKREQKLLGAPASESFDISPAIKLIDPPKTPPVESRTDQDVRAFLKRERLLSAIGERQATPIPATKRRTAEEHQKLIEEIGAELATRYGATVEVR